MTVAVVFMKLESEPEPPVGGDAPSPQTASSISMRVALHQLDLAGGAIACVSQQPDRGRVEPNADGSVSHILTGKDEDQSGGSTSYEVALTSGQKVQVNVDIEANPSTSADWPWPLYDVPYYEVDPATNRFIIEPGADHHDIYMTAGGQTRASLGGLTNDEIVELVEAGDEKLEPALGWEIAKHLVAKGRQSLHLLYERGGDYVASFGDEPKLKNSWKGQSAHHPIVFGSYGTGARPKLGALDYKGDSDENTSAEYVVFQELHATRIHIGRTGPDGAAGGTKDCIGIVFDGIDVPRSEDQNNVEMCKGTTGRRLKIQEAWRPKPKSGDPTYSSKGDRCSNMHIWQNRGCMFEDLALDIGGFGVPWDYNRSAQYKDYPEYFSHLFYSDEDCFDVDISNVFGGRGAYAVILLRSGGLVQWLLGLDSNVGISHGGGDYVGIHHMNVRNTFLQSAGKRANADQKAGYIAGKGCLFGANSAWPSLDQLVLAHFNSPYEGDDEPQRDGAVNLPPSYQTKSRATGPAGVGPVASQLGGVTVQGGRRGYEKVAVRRWTGDGGEDRGIEGLDPQVLDDTCVQYWVAQKLGVEPATVNIVMAIDWFMAQDAPWEASREFLRWALPRFGMDIPDETPRALTFIPSSRGTGAKWHETCNWVEGRAPIEKVAGDDIDIWGHRETRCIKHYLPRSLSLSGGEVILTGYLKPDAITGPGEITIRGTGQLWLPNASEPLTDGHVAFAPDGEWTYEPQAA